MKRIGLVLCLAAVMILSIASSQIEMNKNKIIMTNGTLTLPEGSFIIYQQSQDLNNDSKPEDIFVYGEKSETDDEYTKNINIAVCDEHNFLKRTNCENISGTNPKVYIMDFNGDNYKDILVVLENENRAVCMVGDFVHSIPKNIMSAQNLKGLQMKLNFLDNFVISAQLENGQMFSINITDKKENLVKNGFYDEDGKFIKGTPYLSPLLKIEPLERENSAVIKFTQQLYVKEDNTILCNVESEMEYTNDTLLINRIEYYVQ